MKLTEKKTSTSDEPQHKCHIYPTKFIVPFIENSTQPPPPICKWHQQEIWNNCQMSEKISFFASICKVVLSPLALMRKKKPQLSHGIQVSIIYLEAKKCFFFPLSKGWYPHLNEVKIINNYSNTSENEISLYCFHYFTENNAGQSEMSTFTFPFNKLFVNRGTLNRIANHIFDLFLSETQQ